VTDRIRVLVGDDDPIVVAGIRATLGMRPDIEIIGEIKTPAQTLSLIESLEPDVVVLDLDWWGDKTAGIQQIRQIRSAQKRVKIIAITAYAELIEGARQAGADEARRKGFQGDELAESIIFVSELSDDSSFRPIFETLSERELEVLRLIAEGLTDNNISRALSISEPTTKSHVRSIISKLAVKNRAEAVAEGFKRKLL
jgi:DNA-binding NarL/FixJ family response regulator